MAEVVDTGLDEAEVVDTGLDEDDLFNIILHCLVTPCLSDITLGGELGGKERKKVIPQFTVKIRC